MRERLTTDCYLVIEKAQQWHKEIIIKKVRGSKPALEPNQIAVKLSISVPAAAFEQFIPNVSIDVPSDLAIKPVVQVTAEPDVGTQVIEFPDGHPVIRPPSPE